MRLCYAQARHSGDRSTQNYAMVFGPDRQAVSWGRNGLLTGVDHADPANHDRPLKYKLTVHAERDAIYRAADAGKSTNGCTMVCPWACCPECAQGIVASGIERLVVHQPRIAATPDRWRDDVNLGLKMCRDGGVEIIWLVGTVNAGISILFDGQRIEV